jgi:hypothetical protein
MARSHRDDNTNVEASDMIRAIRDMTEGFQYRLDGMPQGTAG